MSKTIQVASKVQTTLKHTQTKLDLSSFSIKDTVETKTAENKCAKSCQYTKTEHKIDNDCKLKESVAIKEDASIPEIPPIVTIPEIRRVLCVEGVTKISVDLETSSRGKFQVSKLTPSCHGHGYCPHISELKIRIFG